jgi:peptide/nickel transport system substrate-binding protein
MFTKVLKSIGVSVLYGALLAVTACGGPVAPPQVATEPATAPTDAVPTETAATPTAEATASKRDAGDTLRLIYFQAPTIVNPHLSAGYQRFIGQPYCVRTVGQF